MIKTHSDKLLIFVADVDSVDVTGITKPSNLLGKTVCEAQYSARYKPTPFGEVLLDEKTAMTEK